MEQSREEPQPVTILYAEDDPVARSITETMITRRFPAVTLLAAENGQVGLELFRQHRPDIVITDINMPILDGIRMAREIKSLFPATIVVVTSAYNETFHQGMARDIGIDHYVLKPINFRELLALIERCIEGT